MGRISESGLGQHALADLYGCAAAILSDPVPVEQALRKAATLAGATILASHVHHFGANGGVTAVLLLMESHLSIHTWPEYNYAAVDVFMCGAMRLDAALSHLKWILRPTDSQVRVFQRGCFAAPCHTTCYDASASNLP